MVFAGLLLDCLREYQAFQKFPQLFILVPALLGLKGNLEMTLASRLSTHANLGRLSDFSEAAVANLSLVQLQGIIVGGVAAVIPIAQSWLVNVYDTG